MTADIGVCGLGVMGRNLSLNITDKGFGLLGYEKSPDLRETARTAGLNARAKIDNFIRDLRKPRAILLMVTAGEPVDQLIAALLPHLQSGDFIADGGNSDYCDTTRRQAMLKERSIELVGLGVSGGQNGARHGPSLMAAGSETAYSRFSPIFKAIAARANDGSPCVEHLSSAPAVGHFVKMMHNGIEYADMQLIAEVYDFCRKVLRLEARQIAEKFRTWNEGPLGSFLFDTTAMVLNRRDDETGAALVDMVQDSAGQKGTGRWAAIAAAKLGVAAPSIAESVTARIISSLRPERQIAAAIFEDQRTDPQAFNQAFNQELLENALIAGKICAYAQGFAVLSAASQHHDWGLNLGTIANVWRAGCIIQANFLDEVTNAFKNAPIINNLMLAPAFVESLRRTVPALREVISASVQAGVSVPVLSASLAYFDAYTIPYSPANLIQAQRDSFGAHGYRRVDRDGVFHTDWGSGK